ncbi:MAG: hypothetical protein OEY86_11150 [Nitrospira sp.]|nr:hypothetical protein [Nitrospira sp.]
MSGIFLSYRREDSAGYAGCLYDHPGLSFDGRQYPMRFTFTVLGSKVLGTMVYHITGETKIIDGRIDGDSLSFKTNHAYVLGADSEEHPYTLYV